ncbi:hypothetical protein BKK52_01320 [Rodentibacter trehalosifermentans]|uniref:Uncharacterized protein n=1 Tax=Rodentibacter trehalosifermentans TaxID=1908263 RepID=A0A1V3J6X4_9PAST|nr:hypothetical protein [Rodentibacter trehalosifermentans]OOF50816.1 hypothetical protein BKK52_01320 [Rodentibacter trehalosifermentans]
MKNTTIFTLMTITMLFIALILNFIKEGINVYTYIALSTLIIQIIVFTMTLQKNNQRKELENKLKEIIDKTSPR